MPNALKGTAAEIYDFADFEFGEDVNAPVRGVGTEMEEAIAPLIRARVDQLEAALRAVMREAFAAFREQGHWWFRGPRPAQEEPSLLRWETVSLDGFWADGMPVTIDARPADLVEALRKELEERWYLKDELAAALAEWRAAIEQAEALLEAWKGE